MPEPAAAPTADQRSVTVVGEGLASAVPDTALLQLGVETRGATPGEALEACSRALEEVIAAVRAAGVEPSRLATSGLGVHPDWEVNAQGQQRPAGYRAAAGRSSMPRWRVWRSAGSCGSRRWPALGTRGRWRAATRRRLQAVRRWSWVRPRCRQGWPSRGRSWMRRSLVPLSTRSRWWGSPHLVAVGTVIREIPWRLLPQLVCTLLRKAHSGRCVLPRRASNLQHPRPASPKHPWHRSPAHWSRSSMPRRVRTRT